LDRKRLPYKNPRSRTQYYNQIQNQELARDRPGENRRMAPFSRAQQLEAALPAAPGWLAGSLAAAAGASKKSGAKFRSKCFQSLLLCIATPR
jgi:hypothetical protein